MKHRIAILSLLLMLLCAACAAPTSAAPSDTTPAKSDVVSFTIQITNACDEAVHGFGVSCTLGGIPQSAILSTKPDGGWVEAGEVMECVISADQFAAGADLSAVSAKVFVVAGGSAQFCNSDPISLTPQNGDVYAYTLTGSETEGYVLQ